MRPRSFDAGSDRPLCARVVQGWLNKLGGLDFGTSSYTSPVTKLAGIKLTLVWVPRSWGRPSAHRERYSGTRHLHLPRQAQGLRNRKVCRLIRSLIPRSPSPVQLTLSFLGHQPRLPPPQHVLRRPRHGAPLVWLVRLQRRIRPRRQPTSDQRMHRHQHCRLDGRTDVGVPRLDFGEALVDDWVLLGSGRRTGCHHAVLGIRRTSSVLAADLLLR